MRETFFYFKYFHICEAFSCCLEKYKKDQIAWIVLNESDNVPSSITTIDHISMFIGQIRAIITI